jgi:hypothetical protein
MLHSGNGEAAFEPADMAPTHGRHMLNVEREPGSSLMHWYFRDGSQISVDVRAPWLRVIPKGVSRSYAEQCARDVSTFGTNDLARQVTVGFLDGSHWLIEFQAPNP